MKPGECEALQTSRLLYKLSSLSYIWFESWVEWDSDIEADFLAVVLTHLPVFARLKEIRFPDTPLLPFRCQRGLLASLSHSAALTLLSLPPLPPDVDLDSRQYATTIAAIAALPKLTDLTLEGWQLTDAAARALGEGGMASGLQRLTLGGMAALSRGGYESLARFTGLRTLTASQVIGGNQALQPLTSLTALVGLRFELSPGFPDRDLGPLASLPQLRSLGWWHAEVLPPAAVRLGNLEGARLRELSLCVDLDAGGLATLQHSCTCLVALQVQRITLPTAAVPAASESPAGAAGAASVPEAPRLRRSSSASSHAAAAAAAAAAAMQVPVLSSVRTLIIGELDLPAANELQPVARISAVFPNLVNVLTFDVQGRGLLQLERAASLRRLVLNTLRLEDEALALLPPLPSLSGLQLEAAERLTSVESAVRALASRSLQQLLLYDVPVANDAFMAALPASCPHLRELVLCRLLAIHDGALEHLTALADSLEQLGLRELPGITPAALQVLHRLRVTRAHVSGCPAISKDDCRALAAEVNARPGRDLEVDYEERPAPAYSLADRFSDELQEEHAPHE